MTHLSHCRRHLAAALASAWVAAGCSAPAPARHEIDVRELAFAPGALAVAVGDTVTWVNHDIVPHTVTRADGAWDSGEVVPGARYTVVVDSAGLLSYLCRYHPTMTGTLTVR